jgi:RNA polymerase sigma-32 factor
MVRAIDPDVSRYMTMVSNLPLLDREQELVLARRFKNDGDQAARDVLVQSHLRFVVAIALGYRRYGLPLGELIAEGNFGLVHALSKFDPERSNRLLTYAAHWIRAYVLNYIMRSWSLVGGGSGALRTKMFFKLRRERVRITNLLGDGEEGHQMLAQQMAVPEGKLKSMLRQLEARDLSLDAHVSHESSMRLVDTLQSYDRNQEELAVSNEVSSHVYDAVQSALAVLDDRERYIVERRMMAEREDELSLAEIGKRLGVSRERARQLETRARRKLRTHIEQLERATGFEFSDLGSAA